MGRKKLSDNEKKGTLIAFRVSGEIAERSDKNRLTLIAVNAVHEFDKAKKVSERMGKMLYEISEATMSKVSIANYQFTIKDNGNSYKFSIDVILGKPYQLKSIECLTKEFNKQPKKDRKRIIDSIKSAFEF